MALKPFCKTTILVELPVISETVSDIELTSETTIEKIPVLGRSTSVGSTKCRAPPYGIGSVVLNVNWYVPSLPGAEFPVSVTDEPDELVCSNVDESVIVMPEHLLM